MNSDIKPQLEYKVVTVIGSHVCATDSHICKTWSHIYEKYSQNV